MCNELGSGSLEQPDTDVGEEVGDQDTLMMERLDELVARANFKIIEIEPRNTDAHPYLEHKEPWPLHDPNFNKRVDCPIGRGPNEGNVGIPMHIGVSIANDPVIDKPELRLIEV